ncbi:acetolactate synthase-1/2/3 large subunit [Lachnospiraceae bacterium KHCPX20]|nr:acetolactate synthase-1/2/3 large subunit [Lachnospiraceae bacterium KHCPX20]
MIFRSIYNKPILLVGNGVRSAGAVEQVHEFARKTNVPVLTTMNGVDLAQDDLHIGFIGTHGNRVANMILNECDLIVSVGARLGIRQVGRINKKFAPKADLIRCDIDEYELSRNIKRSEEKHHTDAADFMKILLSEDTRDYSEWKSKCLEAKQILDHYDKQPGNYAVEKIASLLPENPVVSVDVGMHQCWCAQSLVLKGDKGRIHLSGGYGTMGCALPFAIGSSIAMNNAISYCITGDGGLQMNIQEFETVKREKLPIKIFVLNNKVLGKISETQHFDNDDRFICTTAESGYTAPDFCKVAKAYGIRAKKLESYEELDQYSGYLTDKQPCLFDIPLPENSLLTPKIKFETQKIRPELDAEVEEKVKRILQG